MKKLLLTLSLLTSPLAAQFNFPARANTVAPTWLNGQYVLLSVDLSGNLRVICTSGCAGGGGNPTGGFLDSVRYVRRIDTLGVLLGGTVTANQGGIWSVNQSGTWTVQQGTPPWSVSQSGTWNVNLGAADSVQLRTGTKHVGRVSVDSLLDSVVVVNAWLGSTAPTVGQKTMANSLPVVVASDQSTLNVNCASGCASSSVAYDGVYSFALVDAAGVAAAQNFVCLFMTVAQNDTIDVLEVVVESYSNVAAATNNSIRLTRVTTCTVGTLQAATAIAEYENALPAPVAEVRTANPTVTAAAEITGFGVSHAITAASAMPTSRRSWTPRGGVFRLLGGEGVVVRQTVAGDTDQRYTITVVWGEKQ